MLMTKDDLQEEALHMRRITKTKYCTWKGLQWSNNLQGHSTSLLQLIGHIQVSLPVSNLLLQHLYLTSFPRYYHFSSVWGCLWPWEVHHLWQ